MKGFESSKFSYLSTIFICGFSIMSLELLAARLLSPVYGNSIYIWGNLICIVMVALALGYFLGGILGDKKPKGTVLFTLVLLAGLCLIFVLFSWRKIFLFSTRFGLIFGSLFSILMLFFAPLTLLGMCSPFAVKMIASEDRIGVATGKIYAVGTLGGVVGILLTVFAMLPTIGTFFSFKVNCLLLLGASGGGLFYRAKRKKSLTLLTLYSFFFLLLSVSPSAFATDRLFPRKDIVLETESVYNYIGVIKKGERFDLYLNDYLGAQSIYDKYDMLPPTYHKLFLTAPLIKMPHKILILGMGAGTSIKQLQHFFSKADIRIDAVELDPKVSQIARDYFGIEEGGNTRIITADARWFLRRDKTKYGMIGIDIFKGSAFIPFHVTTREFFESVFNHLEEEGMVMMNVPKTRDERKLFELIGNTMLEVFPSVFSIRAPGEVEVFLATKEDTDLATIQERLRKSDIKELKRLVDNVCNNVTEYNLVLTQPLILTDDLAPVEEPAYNVFKKRL